MSSFTLKQHEITVNEIHRNLPPSALYEHAILHEKDAHIAENGALVAYSGVKTGRSSKDNTTNFAAYEKGVSAEVKAAGPVV
jgi:phosphoenolpyruvate carboxykinase (ATP)